MLGGSVKAPGFLLKFVFIDGKFLKKTLGKTIKVLQEFFLQMQRQKSIKYTWKDGKSTKFLRNEALFWI